MVKWILHLHNEVEGKRMKEEKLYRCMKAHSIHSMNASGKRKNYIGRE